MSELADDLRATKVALDRCEELGQFGGWAEEWVRAACDRDEARFAAVQKALRPNWEAPHSVVLDSYGHKTVSKWLDAALADTTTKPPEPQG